MYVLTNAGTLLMEYLFSLAFLIALYSSYWI